MNQIDLQNRHAIVTGTAQGIGSAIAKRLLAFSQTLRPLLPMR